MAVAALALFLGFPKGSYASASMIEKKVPVLLQINEYDPEFRKCIRSMQDAKTMAT
jgi:hypothetical protein